MATFSIRLVPQEQNLAPTNAQLEQAQALLRSYCSYNGDEVKLKRFSKPTLVDSGEAFESMECPLCHEKVDRFGDEEQGEWWAEMEDQIDASEDPLSISLVMPCCDGRRTVQQLNFGQDAAFAKWEISVRDYELGSGAGRLDAEQLGSLESTLGGKLIQIVSVGY